MQVDANTSHTLDVVRYPESRAARQVEAANNANYDQGAGSSSAVSEPPQASVSSTSEPVRSDPGPDSGRNIDISV